MKRRKNKEPEQNVKYLIQFPDGRWHGFVYRGTTDTGRLIFINTMYGTETSMTPERFSYISTMYPHTTSPYVLDEHYPLAAESIRAEKERREEQKRAEERALQEKADKQFKQAVFRLKTLPIDVEDTIAKAVGINPRAFAVQIEKEFGIQEADTFRRISALLERTPYSLPKII